MGSFAKFAAEKYGASVVGITVSKSRRRSHANVVELSVEIRVRDYRM